MSGDRGSRRANTPSEAELLAAYADGITELLPDERHRVEARLERDPELRDEHGQIRGLIDRLRALPPEHGDAGEPDWAAMERSIRDAVGRDVPRPWWQRWTWLAPATTLVTAMAVLLVVMRSRGAPVGEATRPAHPTASVTEPRPHAAAADDHATQGELVPLWLDGAEVDVDVTAPAAAELFGEAAGDDETAQAEPAEDSLLPASDLAWVDNLDADALARAEHWLATAGHGKKKG